MKVSLTFKRKGGRISFGVWVIPRSRRSVPQPRQAPAARPPRRYGIGQLGGFPPARNPLGDARDLVPALPRSNRAVPKNEHVLRYVKPSSMQLGRWDAGAEWESATSLTFEQEELRADRYANSTRVHEGEPCHPVEIIRNIQMLYAHTAQVLDKAGQVVDTQDPACLRLFSDHRSRAIEMVLEVKTWPAVPGITVPKKPVPETRVLDGAQLYGYGPVSRPGPGAGYIRLGDGG